MRANNPKNKSKSGGIAAARLLFKAKLWWLSGYPVADDDGVAWRTVPFESARPGEVVRIDRRMLSEATHAAKKLRGHFPRALPALVGDGDAWLQSVLLLFDQLKHGVNRHDQVAANLFESSDRYQPQARRLAARLVDAHPQLRPAIEALSWTLCSRVGWTLKYLRWIQSRAESLQRIVRLDPDNKGPVSLIQLAHLAMSAGATNADPLVELLAHPRIHDSPIHADGHFGRLDQATRKRKVGDLPPGRPDVVIPRKLSRFLDWTLTVDCPTQRRALRMIDACRIGAFASSWGAWWNRFDGVLSESRKILRREMDDHERAKQLAPIEIRLDHLLAEMPDEICGGEITDAVRDLAQIQSRIAIRDLVEIMNLVSRSSRSMAIRFLIHYHTLHRDNPRTTRRRLPVLLSAFREFVRATKADPAALRPWDEVPRRWSVDDELMENDFPVARIADYFAACRIIHAERPGYLKRELTNRVEELTRVVSDAALVARLALLLVDAKLDDEYRSATVLRAAIRLSEPSYERFAELAAALDRMSENESVLVDDTIAKFAKHLGQHFCLLPLVFTGPDAPIVVECAKTMATLKTLNIDIPYPSRWDNDRDWIDTYPQQLREALIALADLDADAESTAARLTRSLLPDQSALRTELHSLEDRVGDSARSSPMRKRIENLQSRLSDGNAVSDKRMARMVVKVQRAAVRSFVTQSNQQMLDTLRQYLRQRYDIDTLPAWLMREDTLQLIHEIDRLRPSFRKLGRLLIQTRLSPGPWDLRDHVANREYIDHIQEFEIDLEPWMEGIGERRYTLTGDMTVSIATEVDPLQIMHMGTPFQTCLTPGDCNFFSAVANAGDINKRVLFARDDNGRIVGRRLLALTGEGAMVLFRTYAHDAYEKIEESFADYAVKLAAAMRSRIIPSGTIPSLVSTDWYDDGSVDIGNQFPCFEENSAFRQALKEIPIGEFLQLIDDNSKPMGLNGITLPLLMDLSEMRERSELAVTLMPRIRRMGTVSDDVCLKMTSLLIKADRVDMAREHFANRFERWVRRRYQGGWGISRDEWLLIVRMSPSRALRLLGTTRDRGIRTWDQEYDQNRLFAAAVAMQRLNRISKATSLYGRVDEEKVEKWLGKYASDRF